MNDPSLQENDGDYFGSDRSAHGQALKENDAGDQHEETPDLMSHEPDGQRTPAQVQRERGDDVEQRDD
jgi:hypothetical protein